MQTSPVNCALFAIALATAVPVLAQHDDETPPEAQVVTHAPSTVDAGRYGEAVVEGMDIVLERQAERDAIDARPVGAPHGTWKIPPLRATFFPHSGIRNVTNTDGDTLMGIGFPAPVDVHEVWVAGQGSAGVWTERVRVIGYRDGAVVATTDWFADVDSTPDRFEIAIENVDRIVVESEANVTGGGWYALDDLAYTPRTKGATRVLIDFEDARDRQVLTGTAYAGLTWEQGHGEVLDASVHAPETPEVDPLPGEGGGIAGSGSPTNDTIPVSVNDFQGVLRGDAGSFSYPPDSHGAIGPAHYVETVNRNFAIYDRDSGAELVNVHLQSFLPDSNGDPRVVYDQLAGRWIVMVTDFSANEMIFLAVSLDDDPTGEWFKTNFPTDEGPDQTCWPDYPTLGYDTEGIYVTTYMVGCGSITIFAIDKAPLIDATPSLGAISAFRQLPFEGAVQPMTVHDDSTGHYFISTQSSSQLRIRRLTGPITSPTLNELGSVAVPTFDPPPDVPALGSNTNLDHTVGNRMLNATMRDGSIWAAHDVGAGGMSMVRWYQIDTATLDLVQSGDIGDPELHYFYGSIAVNAAGDAMLGFSGSNADQYAAIYATGRRAGDSPGTMGAPILIKEGTGPQNNIDGVGRNRWGDYSMTNVDPVDDDSFWTIQEYGHDVDIWGTWIANIDMVDPSLEFDFPNGLPDLLHPDGTTLAVQVAGVDGQVVDPANSFLHYDDGSGFQTTPLVPAGGDVYDANFPALECGANVHFYISAQTTGGATATSPSNAPQSSYAALVAIDVVTVASEDFETGTGGWVGGVPGDDASTGLWVQLNPIGTLAQPGDDHTPDPGTICWFTGQGTLGGTLGEEDVDGGSTTLLSPVIDLSGVADARIGYWRWYSNDLGTSANDDEFVIDITTDGGDSWINVETVGPAGAGTSGGWIRAEFLVSEVIGSTPGEVQMRFVASDLTPRSIVEAAIDDFTITRLVCGEDVPGDVNGDGVVDVEDLVQVILDWGPCPPPCPSDLNGDGEVDVEDLVAVILNWS